MKIGYINVSVNVQYFYLAHTHTPKFRLPFATSESGRYPKRTVVWIDLSYLSPAYQEYLVALNWCRHKWYKEHDQLYTHIFVVQLDLIRFCQMKLFAAVLY